MPFMFYRRQLKDTFFNPDPLYEPGMIDQVIRGLATTSMETLDQFITEEVTNHLFEDKNVPFSGLDLVALNLQRGEHPSTVTVRRGYRRAAWHQGHQ